MFCTYESLYLFWKRKHMALKWTVIRQTVGKPSNPRGNPGLSNLAEVLQQSVKLIFRGLAVIHALCLCLLIVFFVQSLSKEKGSQTKEKINLMV